ncbi:MAG: enoyl-CoA hydratase/isomerase family protein [Deltaproteobacteria bacterium]|nr:enoyl-CoA hydratase/isomerase family protein [Deltaproteobacteria bacterium]
MTKNNAPLIYRKEKEIVFIEINRPEKKNAINFESWKSFDSYFDDLISSQGIRALVITGHPADIFSAGVDVTPSDKFISDMFQALQNQDEKRLVEGFGYIQSVLTKLARLTFPTIAAINGICYSGAAELALACDLRVAREDVVICFQEARLGLIPDLGGTVRLAKLVGPGRAKDLIFSGRKIDAKEAKQLGLVNHVFPKENFRSRVTEYVENITANAPMALRVVKEIIDSTISMDEDQALAFEREKAASNVLSGQCIEGITAFLEKRSPKWPEKAGSG